MTNTKDIIIKLKEVRDTKGLSYNDILGLMEQNGDYLSKSTLSRVFAEGSEETSFKFDDTIRPIANALLDLDTIEEDDDMDVKAMKSLLQYKSQYIKELEKQNTDLQLSLSQKDQEYFNRLEQIREQYNRNIDFLKNQINLKDKRMDFLLDSVSKKDEQHNELLKLILSCPARKDSEKDCSQS